QTLIVPIASLLRSIGTDNRERKPTASWLSRVPGYSLSISGTISSTCTVRRSMNARPFTVVRESGTTTEGEVRAPEYALRRRQSPSARNTVEYIALQSFVARSATASSTGCTSVGELLITFSTSAVAVWRSRASLV